MLMKLQGIDAELDKFKKEGVNKEKIRLIREIEANINKVKGELTGKEERLKLIKKEIKNCENQSEDFAEKCRLYRVKMYSGEETNSKELMKLEEKIADVTKKTDAIEHEWTQLSEEADSLEEDIENFKKILRTLVKDYKREVEDYKKAKSQREEKIKFAREERDKMEIQIDNQLIKRYNQRRMQNKGVVAILKDGNCNGCGMEVSSEKFSSVSKEETVQKCDFCGRFLLLESNS